MPPKLPPPPAPKKKVVPLKVGEGPFSFDASLNAFLFFGEGDGGNAIPSPVLVDDAHGNLATDILIPLAPCIYRLADYTMAKREPITLERCVLKLGVLRCLARECRTMNTLLWERLSNDGGSGRNGSIEEDELGKMRFMELLSNCGIFQKVSEMVLQRAGKVADRKLLAAEAPSSAQNDNGNPLGIPQVRVDGLDDFLKEIERLYSSLARARSEIAETQTVSFYPGLGELFSPGAKLLCFPEGMEGSSLGCSCVQSWYEEELNKATNKIKRRFILFVEYMMSVGDEIVFVAASDVYPEFYDTTRNVPVKDLKHQLITSDSLLARLQQRGEFYASVAVKNHYLEYYADSFFPIIGGGWKSNAVRPLSKGGRVMVDVKRGILEGHLPTRGSDGMAETVREAIKLFDQSKRSGVAVPFRTAVLDLEGNGGNDSDRCHLWQAWPMLTGFSFTARIWGKLLLGMPKLSASPSGRGIEKRPSIRRMGVEVAALGGEGSCGNCGYIKFQEKAFDQLVLAEDKKELIRAVARNGGGAAAAEWDNYDGEDDSDDEEADDVGLDVVANKGGASIFLLSGPPGTGKTLTAEAIAELLRKPLYIVTAGDLGITASEVEKTVGSVLELCQTWDALVLIDEADVFLEARQSTEIERNALVCVFLRLLEYYSGCLFLSSNRSAASIDAAIASRITVMLSYPQLDAEGRKKVWKNLLNLIHPVPVDPDTGKISDKILRNPRRASKFRVVFTDEDYTELATGYQLNGRQIKNSIVLARALARERGSPLNLTILDRAVNAVAGEVAAIKQVDGTY